MCSYNRINNSYGCQNSKTINGLLKGELGFQGFVVSDWGAQHAGYASAAAGLDQAMPLGSPYFGPSLIQSIKNHSLPESRLDDMATRIIAAWYQMSQNSPDYPSPGIGMPANMQAPHAVVNAKSPASQNTLLQGAIEGHVLVKNSKNVLPLRAPPLLSLFGYDAMAPRQNNPGSSILDPWYDGEESYSTQGEFSSYVSQIAINGTIISGGGSGANSPSYISAPYDALQEQAYQDGTTILWDLVSGGESVSVDAASAACLVCINAYAEEGSDRLGVSDKYSDSLVESVASQCNNTIVVIHNAGIRLVDQWIENPNVTAVIYAHLPGQDSGRALVQVLYGMSNPSGKLPYTVAKDKSQYGHAFSPDLPKGEFQLFPQSNFTEGLLTDYRYFDAHNITPRFEFGFGLSYTTFSYSNLRISPIPGVSTSSYPRGPILPGGAVRNLVLIFSLHVSPHSLGQFLYDSDSANKLTGRSLGRHCNGDS